MNMSKFPKTQGFFQCCCSVEWAVRGWDKNDPRHISFVYFGWKATTGDAAGVCSVNLKWPLFAWRMAVPGLPCHGLALHCAACFTDIEEKVLCLRSFSHKMIADRCELCLFLIESNSIPSPALFPHTFAGASKVLHTQFFWKCSKYVKWQNKWMSLHPAHLSCKKPFENVSKVCTPSAAHGCRHSVHLYSELWVWAAVCGTSWRISRGNITVQVFIPRALFLVSLQ